MVQMIALINTDLPNKTAEIGGDKI